MLKLLEQLKAAWEFGVELMTPDVYNMNRDQIEKYLSQSDSHEELEYRQKELMRRGIL